VLTDGRVSSLTFTLNPPLSLAEALALSHDFLPSDSVRAEATAAAIPTANPNLYRSEWLAGRFTTPYGVMRPPEPSRSSLTSTQRVAS
jgi:hypothetical protein